MGEPKDTNIFKIRCKNNFINDIKNPVPNKILLIKKIENVKLFTKMYIIKPNKKLSLLDCKNKWLF